MRLAVSYQVQTSVVPTDNTVIKMTGYLAMLPLLSEKCTQSLFEVGIEIRHVPYILTVLLQ